MNNQADEKLNALFRAARAEVPDTSRAEFGFETRLMARIKEERSSSVFAWAWRLAPFFAALAMAAGYWTRTTPAKIGRDADILVEATRRGDERVLMTYMTGERR